MNTMFTIKFFFFGVFKRKFDFKISFKWVGNKSVLSSGQLDAIRECSRDSNASGRYFGMPSQVPT